MPTTARSRAPSTSSSRPRARATPDHDWLRFLRIAFYELSHPLLPNALVDVSSVAEKKDDALAAFASQQAVRDYAGAMRGLNAYRRLTLGGHGPVEAFRLVTYAEASTTSFEELRRAIGPSTVADGSRGPAPVSVVIRTRNRPALLREALESLARADGAARDRSSSSTTAARRRREVTDAFRAAFDVVARGAASSAAAAPPRPTAVSRAAREELVAFLDDDDRCFPDHLERLCAARSAQGPEPVVYSDAVTVRLRAATTRDGSRACGRSSTRSTSTRTTSLYANYIPIHTLLLPRELFRKVGGFDEGLEYSEDWDFLIRLSAETPFRHLRAVTCEYRVFEAPSNEPTHVAAGAAAFQDARRKIFERYAARRTDAGLAPRARPDAGAGRRSGTTATASRRASCASCASDTAARPSRSRASRRSAQSERARLDARRTSCSTAVWRRSSRRTRSTTTSSRRRTSRSSA